MKLYHWRRRRPLSTGLQCDTYTGRGKIFSFTPKMPILRLLSPQPPIGTMLFLFLSFRERRGLSYLKSRKVRGNLNNIQIYSGWIFLARSVRNISFIYYWLWNQFRRKKKNNLDDKKWREKGGKYLFGRAGKMEIKVERFFTLNQARYARPTDKKSKNKIGETSGTFNLENVINENNAY